jgi:predicted porin
MNQFTFLSTKQETTLMKKATLAIAALAACTSSAWAQSSVTLYGIVDVAVRYTDNEQAAGISKQSVVRVVGGGMSNSRLGINFTEDMGDGLKAIGNLESRLNADTGTAPIANGYPFWMQSWVGLQGGFGRVTLGRQYNVLFDLVTSTYASYPYSPYFDAYKPEIGLSLGSRADNMVKYMVEAGPFRGALQVSAGEGSATGGKTIGGYVRYSDAGLSGGAGYESYQLGSGKKVKASTVGASYRVGDWYLNAGYAVNKVDTGFTAADAAVIQGVPLLWGSFGNGGLAYTNPAIALGADKRTMWSVGVGYQITAQLNLGGHYYHGKQSGPGFAPLGISSAAVDAKADFLTMAADFAFSKRTDAYLEFDHTKLGGANASLTAVSGAANLAQTRSGLTIGLRHRF